ncbi:MAG: DUF1905 domain-containing protein [Taibaiella sp.]|nr:DUF1905 domain-containing protein [Taibaiella sp.]
MQHLIFEGDIVLEKMPMKGGWTYALLPAVIKGGKKNFGWTRVNALIDDFELNNASLMPIKGGRLFLAVKAEIRKKIGKEAGDTVRILLYGDKPVDEVVEDDFTEALKDDPEAWKRFQKLPDGEQKAWRTWIYAAGNSEAIVERMAKAIDHIAAGRKNPILPLLRSR